MMTPICFTIWGTPIGLMESSTEVSPRCVKATTRLILKEAPSVSFAILAIQKGRICCSMGVSMAPSLTEKLLPQLLHACYLLGCKQPMSNSNLKLLTLPSLLTLDAKEKCKKVLEAVRQRRRECFSLRSFLNCSARYC